MSTTTLRKVSTELHAAIGNNAPEIVDVGDVPG